MRYRKESPTGDYQFGLSDAQFLVDSPETVAQAAKTRLELRTGDWYLDLTEGTPYKEKILGENTDTTYDQAVQERILGTQGVTGITQYASYRDQARKLTIGANITTLYGDGEVTT